MDSLDTVSFCIAQAKLELVEILLSLNMEGWFLQVWILYSLIFMLFITFLISISFISELPYYSLPFANSRD